MELFWAAKEMTRLMSVMEMISCTEAEATITLIRDQGRIWFTAGGGTTKSIWGRGKIKHMGGKGTTISIWDREMIKPMGKTAMTILTAVKVTMKYTAEAVTTS